MVRKRHFLRCHLYINASFYQDRLGTNIGKTQKKSGVSPELVPFGATNIRVSVFPTTEA